MAKNASNETCTKTCHIHQVEMRSCHIYEVPAEYNDVIFQILARYV
uniref:Uncharacterized protein n=1 Tax=Rhizophora mucronata TaxID=61149 RepID=A0A2P2NNH9_RHIMU